MSVSFRLADAVESGNAVQLQAWLTLLQAYQVLFIIKIPVDRETGYTLLHLACLEGHVEVVKTLLRQPMAAETIRAKDTLGRTPLHLAAAKGHLEVVRVLIAQPEAENTVCMPDGEHGATPLHLAAAFGHLSIVTFLIGHPKGKKAIGDELWQAGQSTSPLGSCEGALGGSKGSHRSA